jgi:hypothetical protein
MSLILGENEYDIKKEKFMSDFFFFPLEILGF